MVCLNDKLPINLAQMKDVIMTNLEKIIENELYYIDNINLNENRKNNLKNNIIKGLRNEFSKDKFIYLMIDNNHCGHKIKRGKNDGNFCCKKITKNGNKKNYVCTKHNKDHIPKIKITKKKETIILAKDNISSNNLEQNNIKPKPVITTDIKLDTNYISQNNKCSLIVNNNKKYQKISDISNDKKINHENRFILNADGIYTNLIKEIPLLDFCINKIKNMKNKKYYYYNIL